MNIIEYPRKLLRLDWLLLFLAVGVSLAGLAFIRAATWASEQPGLVVADSKQFVWLILGVMACLATAMIDYRVYFRFFPFIGLASLAILVITLIFAKEIQGSKSWIIIGPFSVQPAEFTKVGFILTLSGFLALRGKQVGDFSTFLGAMVITGIFVLLILAQGDNGTALVFLPVSFMVMFVAGVSFLWISISIFSLVGLGTFAYFFLIPDYVRDRILTFMDPTRDPQHTGYHLLESLRAIISGDLAGKGYMQGVGTVTGRLPKNVSHTDFIFPTIGEEHGFLGSAALILALALILFWGLRIAFLAGDRAGTVLAVGIVALFFTHIYQNIGMTMQMMPITGIPLPFISYGGSFLVSCFLALGILQSINIHRATSNKVPLL